MMLIRRLLPALILFLSGTSVCFAGENISGKEVFDKHCIYCHAAGEEYTGTRQLAATRGKDKAVLEERNDLPADYIKYIVRHGLKAMPPFLPTAVTDAELKAVTDYLTRNP